MTRVLENGKMVERDVVVKQIKVYAYKTTDGKIFNTKEMAEEHEANEQFVKSLIQSYQFSKINNITCRHTGGTRTIRHWSSNAVYGLANRGGGYEIVEPRRGSMEAYTRYVISQIKA